METFPASGIDKDPDAALVDATKYGNAHAFEKLVLRYERRVFAVAQRITNNRADAEDVVQESFHKAFVHIDGFQEKSRFSTWLTRIAVNEALTVLRRRRRALKVLPDNPGDDAKSVTETLVDLSPNPEESCWQRERSELLTKAINHLGTGTRRTILLCVMEERTLEETAQILGTSIAAVKSRLFHGRRKLRGTVDPRLLRRVYEGSPTGTHARLKNLNGNGTAC